MRRTVWLRFLAAISLGAGILSANPGVFSVQTLYSSGSSTSQLNTWLAANGVGSMSLGTSGSDMIYTPGAGVVTLNVTGPVAFDPSGSFNNDVFLIATPSGSLNGWQQSLGSSTQQVAFSSPAKGLADATLNGYQYIYLANSSGGGINFVPSDPNAPDLTGNFKDPNLSGYTATDIQNINGTLYVTYTNSAGNGVIDAFDTNGNFVNRVSSDSSLSSPTTVSFASAGFGTYGGDLLVGSAGGTIGAYNPTSGAFVGLLHDAKGNTITIDGLTGLQFGTGALQNTLFFTAAPSTSSDPSFGDITLAAPDPTTAAPEPSTWLLAGGVLLLMAWRGLPLLRRRASGTVD